MIKAGIVGASGYSGEELVKLLSGHPKVDLACVTSRSLAGTPVADALPRIRAHVDPALTFTASDPQSLASADVEVVFLALPHGVASEYAIALAEAGKCVIDLSADFRLNSPELYETYYGHPHPAPEWLAKTPYVLPELAADDSWKSANLIACPGCYPTSVLTPLAPLLAAGVVAQEGIVVNSFSGVSGAGKKAAEAFIYCERNESAKAYGVPSHRHLSEIEEQLSQHAGADIVIQFNPHLAPMSRGIATTIVAKHVDGDAYAVWQKQYAGKPFVHILPSGTCPDTAHVSFTNCVQISAVKDLRTGNLVITSAIDNLVKGASGQAIQIMNLKYGFAENAGLV